MSSSSAASSCPASPKQAALDLGDLDALLKAADASASSAPEGDGSATAAAAAGTGSTAAEASLDLMAALDALGGSGGGVGLPGAGSEAESEGAGVAPMALDALGLPDLSSLDALGGFGDAASTVNTSSTVGTDAGDLSTLDALAGLDALDVAGISSGVSSASSSSATVAAKAAAERPLIRDHYEAEDTNVAGMRRGKKKPTLNGRGAARFAMEDAHAAEYPFNHSAQEAFFGVFDGFAGKDCAADATRAVPAALAANLGAAGLSADLGAVWPKVFADADAALRAHEYVGCTCTAVLVWAYGGERYVQAANVGDSNVYLYRGDTAVMLSTEHKVTSAAERARIQAMGIEMTPGQTRINGVAVARALGTHFIKDERLGIVSTPSVSPAYRVQPDDRFLVIASDGLWDVISGQAACEMVRDLPDAAAMATRLLRHAVSCSKCVDNVTVVVVRL